MTTPLSPHSATAKPAPIWRHKGVFIDIGHGAKPDGYDPGAVHSVGVPHEHALNTIAARACAHELTQAGVPVRVSDARLGNYQAGLAAAGYDVLVSIHHNATMAGKSAQGTEALFHAAKATAADKQLAAMAAEAMAGALAIPNRGAKGAKLSVLSGAHDAKVRAAVLAELYFMHSQTPANPNPAAFADWSTRGGAALGQAIVRWLTAAR